MVINGNLAPEKHGHALRCAAVLKDAARICDALGILGTEEHGYTVVALVRQQMAALLGFLSEESVWHLEENACAVTGVRLKTLASTMLEVDQHAEGVIHHTVGSLSLEMCKRPDATGIMLELRPIQAACLGLLHVPLLARLATMAAGCQ
jgi:hypothetical protein